MLTQQEEGSFKYNDNIITISEPNQIITSVVPGDFNNDLLLDAMVTTSSLNDGAAGHKPETTIQVFWGTNMSEIGHTSETLEHGPFRDQPLIME